MIIRLRSIKQTEADMVLAAKSLLAAGKRGKRYEKAMWAFLKGMAPLYSDPLSYYLNPVNHQSLERLYPWVPEQEQEARRQIFEFYQATDFKQFIDCYRMFYGRVFGKFQNLGCLDRRVFDFSDNYTNEDPDVYWSDDQWDEFRFQVDAFRAFHSGRIKKFAQKLLKSPKAGDIPPFWHTLLRWHSGDRGKDVGKSLLSAVTNKRMRINERLSAAAMLCGENALSSKQRQEFSIGFAQMLQDAEEKDPEQLPLFLWNLSGLLEALKPIRCADESKRMSQLMKILGPLAEAPSLKSQLSRIQSLKRGLVSGGLVEERKGIGYGLAALTGISPTEVKELNPSWSIDNKACLIKAAADAKEESLKNLELKDKLLLAWELQEWDSAANRAFAELLDNDGSNLALLKTKIIVGTNKGATGSIGNALIRNDASTWIILDLPERSWLLNKYFETLRLKTTNKKDWEPDAVDALLSADITEFQLLATIIHKVDSLAVNTITTKDVGIVLNGLGISLISLNQTEQPEIRPATTAKMQPPPKPENVDVSAHEELWKAAVALQEEQEWWKKKDLEDKCSTRSQSKAKRWLAGLRDDPNKPLTWEGKRNQTRYQISAVYMTRASIKK